MVDDLAIMVNGETKLTYDIGRIQLGSSTIDKNNDPITYETTLNNRHILETLQSEGDNSLWYTLGSLEGDIDYPLLLKWRGAAKYEDNGKDPVSVQHDNGDCLKVR